MSVGGRLYYIRQTGMALHELLADPGFVVTIKLIQLPLKDNLDLKVTNSGDTKCSFYSK